jgi:hypothetical protein
MKMLSTTAAAAAAAMVNTFFNYQFYYNGLQI